MSDETKAENPVIADIKKYDLQSAIAVAGHPLHAMSVHFPIALVIGTLVLDLLYWFSPTRSFCGPAHGRPEPPS